MSRKKQTFVDGAIPENRLQSLYKVSWTNGVRSIFARSNHRKRGKGTKFDLKKFSF